MFGQGVVMAQRNIPGMQQFSFLDYPSSGWLVGRFLSMGERGRGLKSSLSEGKRCRSPVGVHMQSALEDETARERPGHK